MGSSGAPAVRSRKRCRGLCAGPGAGLAEEVVHRELPPQPLTSKAGSGNGPNAAQPARQDKDKATPNLRILSLRREAKASSWRSCGAL